MEAVFTIVRARWKSRLGSGEGTAAGDELEVALATNLDAAFERLVLAYQDRLYSFGLHLCGRPADAEEIAQDAFVRAYRALGRYPAERIRALRVRPWLLQIALNVHRNRVRRKGLDLVALDPAPDGAVDDPPAAVSEQPEEMAERAEERALLRGLLLRLPERQRVAVVLRHVEGLGYEEIAVLLGQPVGTVKANVHRGVRALRAALVLDQDEGESVSRGSAR
jgi:RNA polymerase sigma-70 factor (ECF subfamily)